MGASEAINGLICVANGEKSHTRPKAQTHDHPVQRTSQILVLIDSEYRKFR